MRVIDPEVGLALTGDGGRTHQPGKRRKVDPPVVDSVQFVNKRGHKGMNFTPMPSSALPDSVIAGMHGALPSLAAKPP